MKIKQNNINKIENNLTDDITEKMYCQECTNDNIILVEDNDVLTSEPNEKKPRKRKICEHGKRNDRCRECSKSAYCAHDKRKDGCKKCCNKINLFPDKIMTRNYKTKELNVVDHIKECYPDFTWICDKKIQDGCSKRRPDLLLDLGTHIIIVEVDENAHTDYDCSCENKRLMELSQDVGHKPIVFIRFNPDQYIDELGNTIKSCWKINKQLGILQIDPKKEDEWKERINTLCDQIQYWIDNQSEKMVEIIELFY
jgi:hypothetical protein